MNTQQKYDKKICVIGLGYIGLPTASILSSKGYDVLGVDINPDVVNTINQGKIHIVEPDLDILVKSAVQSGKLKASLKPDKADIFYICVPTPFKDDHEPDISYVEAASEAIAPLVEKGNLVILESTSPPKTTERVAQILKKSGLNIGKDVFVAHAPERVLPGRILHEAIYNDRIIGGINKESSEVCRSFYESFVMGEIFVTDSVTAEMAKLCENAFRDVNIAFANELSLICDKLGINVWELIKLANKHPRVNILSPGAGVGGHCIAVDPWFIVHSAPLESRIIRTAREVNNSKPEIVIEKVVKMASKLKHPVIGCMGLSYKPDIDDLRESPAKYIVESLVKKQVGDVLVCEPNVEKVKNPAITLVNCDTLLKKADIIVALVAHKEFRQLDPHLLKEKMVVDVCGIWQN